MQNTVVGIEARPLKDGKYQALGYFAVFPTHIQRFSHLREVAAALAPWPIVPVRLPDEEGWDNAVDIPQHDWQLLQTHMHDIRKKIRLRAEAAKMKTPAV